ncbi:MAG: hypothetical protein QT02_C0006G0032 [archaeon GW2011_AR9]|nr:MAG: hypothetical protein QT02_C0006G0032 [archaeon GW2011_AR9]HIH12607.1 hypothetical protein [Candidatus Woesearchaeota archaeon]
MTQRKALRKLLFEDNGAGYDAGLLSVLFSTKRADALSVGQFGEGLKLIAAAALRENIDMEYRSHNWVAKPLAKRETIGGRQVQRLCFDVTENGYDVKESQTIFRNPSAKFVQEVLTLPEKVLVLGEEVNHTPTLPHQYRVLYVEPQEGNAYPSRIIEKIPDETGHQNLFVKGVRMSRQGILFSYDLGLEDITPDRIYADRDKVVVEMGALIKSCTNEAVIEAILKHAHEVTTSDHDEMRAFNPPRNSPQSSRFFYDPLWHGVQRQPNEFLANDIVMLSKVEVDIKRFYPQDIDFSSIFGPAKAVSDQGARWAAVFKRMFGDNAVIASDNTNHNEDASLMGYVPVKMNVNVVQYLREHGIGKADDYATAVKQDYRWVESGTLTEEEHGTLSELKQLTTMLGCAKIPEVRVYEGLFTNQGVEQKSAMGVTIFSFMKAPQYVGLKRSHLQKGLEKVLPTYLHELGHFTTRAQDHSR